MSNKVYYLEQKRYKRKIGNHRNSGIFFFMLIGLLILLIGFLLINSNQRQIVKVVYGQVVDGFSAKALVVRDETVFFTPQSGFALLQQEEGRRVSYGQPILQIRNEEKTYMLYNHQAGLVSYATDGLEELLTPAALEHFQLEMLKKLTRKYVHIVSGEQLKKGQPGFRIVNNSYQYLVVKVNSAEAARYNLEEVVFIRSKRNETGLIEARIIDKKLFGEQALIFIRLDRFIDQWLNIRWVEIDFIKNIYRGLVIPRQAVFNQVEGTGVLVVSSEGYQFQPIEIEDGSEEYVVVKGLEVGDRIVANPEAVDYGKEMM